MMRDSRPIYLVSACLVGLCTRYDGAQKESPECLSRLQHAVWIPVCPEQLGGLPTPREAADIVGGDGRAVLSGRARVLTKTGEDVTDAFRRGAEQVLKIVRAQRVEGVFLKARSPSCAVSGTIGVTAALLESAGIPLTEF